MHTSRILGRSKTVSSSNYRVKVIDNNYVSVQRRLFSTRESHRNFNKPGVSFQNGVVVGLVVGGTTLGLTRWFFGRLVSNGQHNIDMRGYDFTGNKPRPDNTKVTIVIPLSPSSSLSSSSQSQSQPGESVSNNNSNNNNTSSMAILRQVDSDHLTVLLESQRAIIDQAKVTATKRMNEILHEEMSNAFDDCRTRGVKQFTTWYFAYSTTYKLLSRAMKAATTHLVTFGRTAKMNDNDDDNAVVVTMKEAVKRDLQLYICDKYQSIVLRPAWTEPKIHRAVVTTLQRVNDEVYKATMEELDKSVQSFVHEHLQTNDGIVLEDVDGERSPTSSMPSSLKKNKSLVVTIPPDAVYLDLDWKAQLQKTHYIPSVYEKTPSEISVALIGTGALAGKAMMTSTVGSSIKMLSGKLATPFVTKAVGSTLGGKAAASSGSAAVAAAAGAGAVASGPVGMGVGAVVGIGMDMALNKGIELMKRDEFIADIQSSLESTQLEWEERIRPELHRTVEDVMFEPIEDLLHQSMMSKKEVQ